MNKAIFWMTVLLAWQSFGRAFGQLSVSIAVQHPSCTNYTNGQAWATATGGSGNYVYLWSNGQPFANAFGLSGGTYTVTVSSGGQTTSASVQLVAPPPLWSDVVLGPDICAQNAAGQYAASAVVSGGTPPYSLQWTNGSLLANILFEVAGTSAMFGGFTAHDANGCHTTSYELFTAPLSLDLQVVNGTCHASCDASINAIGSGGKPPYTYAWSNGMTSSVAFPLMPGTYTVTMTDVNGCSQVASASVTEPPILVVDIAMNEPCAPTLTDLNVTASGGTWPYHFLWSTGSFEEDLYNLPAGAYTVTVHDDKGCEGTGAAVVGSGPLNVGLAVGQPICAGDAGQVSVQTVAGAGPFSMLWSTGDTAAALTDLAAGAYTVSVTDAAQCSGSASASIGSVSAMAMQTAQQPTGCNQPSGTASVQVSGGWGGYTFLWSNGLTGATISGLNAGVYTVTATDVLGCLLTAEVAVSPAALGFDLGVLPSPCAGVAGGIATVGNIVGDFPPFGVSWGGTVAANLAIGNYTVTVTDGQGCTLSSAFVVTAEADVSASLATSYADCNGMNGALTVTATGGDLAQITWSNGQQTATADGLAVGVYTVTVTASTGCTATASGQVQTVSQLGFEVAKTDVICDNLQNGTAQVVVNSGVGPFGFHWSTADTLAQLTGLAAGTYTVTVHDATGCGASNTVTILPPTPTSLAIAAEQAICNGDSVGYSFTAAYTGNLSEIVWQTSGGASVVGSATNVAMFLPVQPVELQAVAHSAQGCLDTAMLLLTPAHTTLTASVPPLTCRAAQLVAEAQASGSAPAYVWAPVQAVVSGGNTANPQLNTFMPGMFSVSVTATDGAKCPASTVVTYSVADSVAAPSVSLIGYQQCQGTVVQFDNPSPLNGFYWQFGDPANPDSQSNEQSPTHTYSTAGNFTALLLPTDICADTAFLNVQVATPPAIDITGIAPPCMDTASVVFNADVSVPGGATAYQWQFGAWGSSTVASPVLSVGVQTVITATLQVSFQQSCALYDTVQVPVSVFQPPLPDAGVTACRMVATPINPDALDGWLYQWSPDNGTLSDVTAGNPSATINETATYTVAVSDGGCTATTAIIVTVPEAIVVMADHDTATCLKNPILLAASGSAGATFSWHLQPSPTAAAVADGSIIEVVPSLFQEYFVMARDSFGCVAWDSVTVRWEGVDVQLSGKTDLCVGTVPDVTVRLNGPGVVGSLQWLPYPPNDDVLDQATTFTATVTNNLGCTDTDSIRLEAIDPTTLLDLAALPDTIFRGHSSQLSATALDGFQYQWSPAVSLNFANTYMPVASPDSTTTYTLVVQDADGCTGRDSVRVTVLPAPCGEPNIYLPNAFSPNHDAHNEVLRVRGTDLTEVYLTVYNRWGQQVFETDRQDIGWDGTYLNAPVSPDVYGFYLRCRCSNGETYSKKGNITVLK